MKEKLEVLKGKLLTPRDKIDFCIFIIHYVLFVLAIVSIIVNIVVILVYFDQDLTNYSKESIINILLSGSIIYSFFTLERFKAVRKKFLAKKDEEKVEAKEKEVKNSKAKKHKKVKKGKKK